MKNNEQLLKTIGEINDKYISKNDIKRKKSAALKLTAGVTACAAAAAGFFVMQNTSLFINKWEEYPVFPEASYENADFIDGTAEGVPEYETDKIFCRIGKNMLYSYVNVPDTVYAVNISVLEEDNIWNEDMELDTLPVFRNLSYSDSVREPTRFLFTDQMLTMAENTAEMLGVIITESEFTEVGDQSQNVQYRYVLQTSCTAEKYGLPDLKINVYSDGEVEIDFSHYGPGVPVNAFMLPEEYSLKGDSNTDGEKRELLLDYLAETFADVLQFEDPKNVSYIETQYSSQDGEPFYETVLRIFNHTDSDTRNILNYGLAFADFGIYGNKLFRITLINKLCVSEYVADYPVISPEEAEKLLLGGVYTSNVYEPYIKGENVALSDVESMELVYRGDNSAYYIPYYRFYVKLEQPAYLEGTDINAYGAFYVPAVELKYLNMGYTLPDVSGEMLDAYPNDKVTFPSGYTIDKTEASRVYEWEGKPILEFDFGILRSPNRFYQNTIDDPYCFDFDTMTFNDDDSMGNDEISYIIVRKGDVISGLPVITAKFRVMWDEENNTEKYISNIVEFYLEAGYITVEGILRYFPEDGDGVMAGDLCFYPDPMTTPLLVPFTNKLGYTERTISFTDGNTSVRTDGGVIDVGNVNDARSRLFDPEEVFKDGNCVKARIDIKSLRYEDYTEEISGAYADFIDWEILSADSEEQPVGAAVDDNGVALP